MAGCVWDPVQKNPSTVWLKLISGSSYHLMSQLFEVHLATSLPSNTVWFAKIRLCYFDSVALEFVYTITTEVTVAIFICPFNAHCFAHQQFFDSQAIRNVLLPMATVCAPAFIEFLKWFLFPLKVVTGKTEG